MITLRQEKGSPLTHEELDNNFNTCMFPPFLHIQEQKPSGTHGGQAIAGWQPRNLNTILVNNITNSSLSNNQITLPIGKYYMEASSSLTAYDEANTGRISLYNYDLSNYILHGINSTASPSIKGRAGCTLILNGYFEINKQTVFELHLWSEITGSKDYSLGFRCNLPNEPEIYSDVRIWKVG